MANVRYPGTAGTTPGTITASDVTYDNTTSGLTADDVQEAIDEIEGQIGGLSYDASDISYDNTTSGLTADDVQEAIDEIEGQIGGLSYDASDISYDNTTSGLTADDVQEALDEIDGNVDTLSGKVYKTDDSTETTIASDDLLPIYDTSATAAKKITVENVVKATVSNPNLLDNPWFTVNQRGQNSYNGAVYSVDRWKVPHVDMTLTVGTNGIVLSNSSANDYFNFMSIYENGFLSPSTTYTMSVMLADGTIKSGQITTPSTLPPSATVDLRAFNDWDNGYAIGFVIETSGACVLYMPIEPGATTPTIRAIKLEKGPISTLALDTAPNYATELLKCQRYFQTTGKSGFNGVGVGQARSTTIASIHFNPFVKFRTTPVLSVDFNHLYLRNAENSIHPTSVSVDTAADSSSIMLAFVGTGFTAGAVYEALMETGYEMTFSADL